MVSAFTSASSLNGCDAVLVLVTGRHVDVIDELKNPQPVAFVQQANIGKAAQVNNSAACDHTPAMRAEKSENAPSELLEERPCKPLDARTPSSPGQADSAMAIMGKTALGRATAKQQAAMPTKAACVRCGGN
jgi:hypothetical protein